jgi:futalosine hydrolase
MGFLVGIAPPENRLPSAQRGTRACGYGCDVILVVAATPEELRGADGAATLICGVGPVEAAARTAAALAGQLPDAILHVGIAGVRSFEQPVFVVGSEAVYCDADDPRWIELRAPADPGLVAAARRALPGARVEPIGTSARVGGSNGSGSSGCEVEAMEGYAVLRAAALAGIPAVEVRVLSNAVGEPDRTKWRFDEAKDALAGALPALIEEVARAPA